MGSKTQSPLTITRRTLGTMSKIEKMAVPITNFALIGGKVDSPKRGNHPNCWNFDLRDPVLCIITDYITQGSIDNSARPVIGI